MPLKPEVVALLGDQFTEDAIAEMLLPEAQTKLTAAGHVIRKKEDDESLISSRARELTDAEIGTKLGGVYQGIEDLIKETTGLVKRSNEKATDFNKRVLLELKTKADAATGGDEVLKQQIQTLTENLELANTTKEKDIATLKEQYFKKDIDSTVSSVLNKIAIAVPSTVKTDAEKQAFADNQRRLLKMQLLNDYTVKEDTDGNKLFYKGEILEKSTVNGAPLTAEDIIKRDFAPYIDVVTPKGGGAGSSGSGTGQGTFQTKADVYEHLKTSGMEEGTNAFTQAAAKIIKEQGIVN